MSEYNGEQRYERRTRLPDDDIPYAEGRGSGDYARSPTNTDWSDQDVVDPVNPGWRRERTTRRSTRRVPRSAVLTMPNSAQDIPLWLQQGGWIFVAAVSIIFILALILVLWMGRSARSGDPALGSVSEPGSGLVSEGAATGLELPNSTMQPPTAPLPSSAFVVVNTEGLGLFLRASADANSEIVATLPEGTRVEQIGEDTQGASYVWRQVRAPDGQEGWVAVDFLQLAE